ncbi:hypothetical protein C4D60_Mb10t25530 [Musa balbisiana]|uniref:Uncharacterized protein n=1 Tax=Musa balbisiana TaxID=52838 RepID=A0A4S8IZR6_MUSBA|nr:hypothetical protein C4D60_Mb10t25530 [Musa balbisiana]
MREPRYPLPRVIQWGHRRNCILLHAERPSDSDVRYLALSRSGLVFHHPSVVPPEGGSTSGPPRGPFPSVPGRTRRPLSRRESSSASSDSRLGVRCPDPGPALRANPFPEVTDPFSDFLAYSVPWPMLFHLETLCVYEYDRSAGGTRSAGFSRAAGAHRTRAIVRALPAAVPYLRLSRFQGCAALNRKDNSSRGPAGFLPDFLTICTDGRSARLAPWFLRRPAGASSHRGLALTRPDWPGSEPDWALTLPVAPFQGTWARSVAEDASPDYNSNDAAARFSSWADPGSLAVTKESLHDVRLAQGIHHASCSTTTDGPLFGHRTLGHGGPSSAHASTPPEGGIGEASKRDAQAGVPLAGWPRAQLAFKDSMVHGFCNSHQVSHFATFFIDARAEISVAESHPMGSPSELYPPACERPSDSDVRVPWRSPRRGW